MSNKAGVFNRMGLELINWEFIECILFKKENEAHIYFQSGNIVIITGEDCNSLKDIITSFPDLNNEKIRTIIKASMSSIKTDFPEMKSKNPLIKTDIPQP